MDSLSQLQEQVLDIKGKTILKPGIPLPLSQTLGKFKLKPYYSFN